MAANERKRVREMWTSGKGMVRFSAKEIARSQTVIACELLFVVCWASTVGFGIVSMTHLKIIEKCCCYLSRFSKHFCLPSSRLFKSLFSLSPTVLNECRKQNISNILFQTLIFRDATPELFILIWWIFFLLWTKNIIIRFFPRKRIILNSDKTVSCFYF